MEQTIINLNLLQLIVIIGVVSFITILALVYITKVSNLRNDLKESKTDYKYIYDKLGKLDYTRSIFGSTINKITSEIQDLAGLFSYPIVAMYKGKVYTAFTHTKQHGFRVRIKEGNKYVSGQAEVGFLVEGTFIRIDELMNQIIEYARINEYTSFIEDEHYISGIPTNKKANNFIKIRDLKG